MHETRSREFEHQKIYHIRLSGGKDAADGRVQVFSEIPISGGGVGDISVLETTRQGRAAYLAKKNFRGDENLAIHAYIMHGILQESGIPTFSFYGLNLDQQDEVIMPYIGRPDMDRDHPQEGDVLCVSPTGNGPETNLLDRVKCEWTPSELEHLNALAEEIIVRSTAADIALTHDSIFFVVRYTKPSWHLQEMFVGDLDQLVQYDQYNDTDRQDLLKKNRGVVAGVMANMKETFGRGDINLELGNISSWDSL